MYKNIKLTKQVLNNIIVNERVKLGCNAKSAKKISVYARSMISEEHKIYRLINFYHILNKWWNCMWTLIKTIPGCYITAVSQCSWPLFSGTVSNICAL